MAGLPIGVIANALKAVTDGGKAAAVADFARRWGIEGRPARRAAEGKEVDISTHLKLCAALGLDPLTGNGIEPCQIDNVDWNRVGIQLQLAFIGTPDKPVAPSFTMRVASKKWGIPLAPLARMKAGSPASAENFFKVCDALTLHPHVFLKSVPAPVNQKHVAEQQQVTR